MGEEDSKISWASAFVAGMLLLILGAIMVSAIWKYNSVDEALKIWASMGTLVGLATGVIATYFFTRETMKTEKRAAKKSEQRADALTSALKELAKNVDKDRISQVVENHPVIQGIRLQD